MPLALLVLTLLRLIAAAAVPVAPDEAYYWVWSRALAQGYYDHPPGVALAIAAGTALAGDGGFGIRLFGPLGLAAASLALARSGNLLFPDRRPGWWAAALFNATLMVNAGAVLITPDTPLIVAWCLTIWAVAEAHAGRDGRWWLAAGSFAGLALLSKYTAVLLGAGLLLWLLLEPRARFWLRDARLWIGGALASAVFAPVVWWNAGHGWASFAKQGGRAGAGEAGGQGQAIRYLGELIGGQAALATPLVFLLAVLGTGAALRRWWRGDAGAGLVATLVLPGAALFLWQATGSRVQGNWPAILYPAGALAAAGCLSPRWDRWRGPALALGLLMSLAALTQAALAPFPLARRVDPTLARLGGWDAFAREVEAARLREGAGFVAAEEYGLASELALRLPPGTVVVGIGERWDLFDLPDVPPSGPGFGKGLLVRSERRGDGPTLWAGAGPSTGVLVRARDGVEAERYRLHPVSGDPGVARAVLPRPQRAGIGA